MAQPLSFTNPPPEDLRPPCYWCKQEYDEHIPHSKDCDCGHDDDLRVCVNAVDKYGEHREYQPYDDDRTPSEARAEMRGDRI